jgi:membrane protein DedA with SNARE-associated domain
MLENIISYLQNIPGIYVLLVIFIVALIENLFPPSPSDAIIVFSGTLIPLGNVHFLGLLIASTLGTTIGFLIMFIIGMNFDKKIVETGRLKFIKIETVMKLEHWFQKWGYWMILINRFLSGTRAVISFFAGMSLLDIKKTTLISFAGAFIWNFILIYSGMVFSENWREIYDKLDVYGYVILGLVIIIALFIFFRNKFKKK